MILHWDTINSKYSSTQFRTLYSLVIVHIIYYILRKKNFHRTINNRNWMGPLVFPMIYEMVYILETKYSIYYMTLRYMLIFIRPILFVDV